MKVLIACEFSGRVRDAFCKLGHDAWSCDLENCDPNGKYTSKHIVGDCTKLLKENWDLLIGHPPCTYLCNSGVRWLYNKDKTKNEERWEKMQKGTEFFKILLEAPVAKIAIENPIQHFYAKLLIKTDYSQIIHPWQFGHPETKTTCLWLKNLPKLTPTNIVDGRENRIHKMPPSADRGKLRSLTYLGIAEAMAQQWGNT